MAASGGSRMFAGWQASDGGCGRIRSSSRAGVVYRGAGGSDYREGLGEVYGKRIVRCRDWKRAQKRQGKT